MPFTDSDSVDVSLPIRGVWLHDPDDPEETVCSFPYGADQRSDSFDAMQAGAYYVGHTDPIFDYGDPSAFSVDVTVDVHHGSDYVENLALLREFAAMRKSLWFRDNRARAVHGSMSNLKVSDQAWGASVSFTFTKSHRAVSTVVI